MRASAHPLSYRVLSLLLDYPEQPLIDALPELAARWPMLNRRCAPSWRRCSPTWAASPR